MRCDLLLGLTWGRRIAGATALATAAAILLGSGGVRAETWSRGAAVARALRQNPQVAAARAVEQQAQARQGQVAAARFPTLSVTLGVGPSLKAELVPGSAVSSTENTYGDVSWDDFSVTVGTQLQLLQPLYTFGKIDLRAQATQHEVLARKAQTDMVCADIAYQVAELYEGLLYARESERFLSETAYWLERSIENTQRQIEAGTGLTEQDLARLQAGLGAVYLGENRARAAWLQAQAGLVAYLGLPTSSKVVPSEEGLDMLPAPASSDAVLFALARKRRPELRALAEGSQALQALADAEAAGNLPDFFALLFATAAYTPGRDVVDTRYVQDPLKGFYPGLLVGARWQITGPMANRRADEKQAMARELDQTRRWAEAGLPAQVTLAWEDIRRARSDAEKAEKAVQVTKQWLLRASADLSIGLGDSRDVTDAARAYLELRTASFDARYRNNVALAALTRATGTFDGGPGGFYPIEEH